MLHNSRNGFTLIELLVSAAIIAVVSGLVFANVGARRTDLTRAAQKLALDIRQAQNLSLAPTSTSICIYGLKAQSADQYFLYKRADCSDGWYKYKPGGSGCSGLCSEKIGTNIVFDGGVVISDFGSGQDVAFEAPEPITYIDGATTTPSLIFTLKSPDGKQKSIKVNRFGGVEIQ